MRRKSDIVANLFAMTVPLVLPACKGDAPAEPAATTTQAPGAVAKVALANPDAAAPNLAVEAEGLRLFAANGSARPLPFGTGWTQVQAALAARGTPETGRAEECGAGSLDYATWPDSLTLYGQNGKFVGWMAKGEGTEQGSAVSTVAGIGPGNSRKELESAYSISVMETTLGVEFSAGELFGLLEGPGSNAKITHLWAGMNCFFR